MSLSLATRECSWTSTTDSRLWINDCQVFREVKFSHVGVRETLYSCFSVNERTMKFRTRGQLLPFFLHSWEHPWTLYSIVKYGRIKYVADVYRGFHVLLELTKPKSNLPNRLIWSLLLPRMDTIFILRSTSWISQNEADSEARLGWRHFALELILLDQDLSVNYCLNYVNAKYLHANKVTYTKNEKYIKCPDIF